MAYSGKFTPKNKEKYLGNVSNIVYRSLWERTAMNYFDMQPEVIKWASEDKHCIISYHNPTKPKPGMNARYYCDFWIKVRKNDMVKCFLIEVKPLKECSPPPKPKNNNAKAQRRYKAQLATYVVNRAKWDQAEKVCKKKGWTFMKMTERELVRGK